MDTQEWSIILREIYVHNLQINLFFFIKLKKKYIDATWRIYFHKSEGKIETGNIVDN